MNGSREEQLARFLNDRYEEARRKTFEDSRIRISQNEYARRIGLSPQSLSQYMNGERLPEGRNKDLLIIAFGEAFLEIVGYDPARAELEELIALYGQMNDKERAKFMTTLRARVSSIQNSSGDLQTA